MLQQVTNLVDVEVGQPIALVLGLGGSWAWVVAGLGSPPASPHSHHPDKPCSTASASPPSAAGPGLLLSVLRSSSPSFTPPGPAPVLPRQGAAPPPSRLL
ncbi:hypothetical protein ACRRTK_009061 [Alexandromys fortis]